ENPLHDAYVVKVNYDFSDKNTLKLIKTELESIDGVFEVNYVENLVISINKNIRRIGLLLIGFAVILICVVYILINNSIKLALYSQRFLIRSMQLVGATAFFIQWPFIIRSFMHGIIGGFIACLFLMALVQYTYNYIPELMLLEDMESFLILGGMLTIFGGLIGFFSSVFVVNKYLKMSLNDLY
ncbi:MAG: ABC transporter permease, partial [Bacteroidota bacterium]|nr:ABC transporter permease [Bacteroidota bacterium]